MNMPNLASRHQAMRAACWAAVSWRERSTAGRVAAGVFCAIATAAEDSLEGADDGVADCWAILEWGADSSADAEERAELSAADEFGAALSGDAPHPQRNRAQTVDVATRR